MNKCDFLKVLTSELGKINPSELQDILQYYNEYFDEAGEENEQAIIDELGSPQKLAKEITTNLSIRHLEDEKVGSNYSNCDFTHGSECNRETMTSEITNFKNIDISIYSGRIELIKANKNAIEYSLNNSEKVTVSEIIGDTLTFKTSLHFTIRMFSFKDSYIKIYYKDDIELETVSLKTVSGKVEINDLTAKTITIKSTSGSQSFTNIKANKFETNGMSGSINIANISSDIVNVHNTSGSIFIGGITCIDTSIKNMSGGISLYNANTGSAKINCASGSICLQGEPKGKTILNTTSGRIKVYSNLQKSEYGYKLSSMSGSTKIDGITFKGSAGEEKLNFIDASAISGSVKIYFSSIGE